MLVPFSCPTGLKLDDYWTENRLSENRPFFVWSVYKNLVLLHRNPDVDDWSFSCCPCTEFMLNSD